MNACKLLSSALLLTHRSLRCQWLLLVTMPSDSILPALCSPITLCLPAAHRIVVNPHRPVATYQRLQARITGHGLSALCLYFSLQLKFPDLVIQLPLYDNVR
eukprot:758653-Hanusia_phi.AAC.4